MKSITLITDGSCLGNPGPGGWAAILRHGESKRELSGSAPETTNNRMEMTAVLEGLMTLQEPCRITIEIDSEYVKKGISQWVAKWKLNGWRTAAKKPVKNQDLWETLDELVGQHEVRWHWVKGHSGHVENERVDQAANDAIDEMLGS